MNKHLLLWISLVALAGCSRPVPTPKPGAGTGTPPTTQTGRPGPDVTDPSRKDPTGDPTLPHPTAEDAIQSVDWGSTRLQVVGDKITFVGATSFDPTSHLLFWATAVHSDEQRVPVALVLVRLAGPDGKAVSATSASKGEVRPADKAGEWRFTCAGSDPLLTVQHLGHGDPARDTWKLGADAGDMTRGRVLLVDPFAKKVEQVTHVLPADLGAIGQKAGSEAEQKKALKELRDVLVALRDKQPAVRAFLTAPAGAKGKEGGRP